MEIYPLRLAKIKVPADLLLRLFMEEVGPSNFSYETGLVSVAADETNMVTFIIESPAHDRHVSNTPIPEIGWEKKEY